jgi:hypothetical protein
MLLNPTFQDQRNRGRNLRSRNCLPKNRPSQNSRLQIRSVGLFRAPDRQIRVCLSQSAIKRSGGRTENLRILVCRGEERCADLDFWHVNSQRGSQSNLVILFIDKNFAD